MKSTITGLFIGVAVVLLASPLGGQAQQVGKVARLGVLLFDNPEADQNFIAFRKGLAELGYAEGKNLTVVLRHAGGIAFAEWVSTPEGVATLATVDRREC